MFVTIVFMDCVRCGDILTSVYYCDPFYGGCGNIDQKCLEEGVCCKCEHPVKRCGYCDDQINGCGYLCRAKKVVRKW